VTPLARRHLVAGWWALFAFAAIGLTLEGLHGFKAGLYLDAGNDTRRLMWRLAHAHGAGLALVNVVFGSYARGLDEATAARLRVASTALLVALVLLPLGFFAGGVVTYGADPGLGVLLVPAGAVALLYALAAIARSTRSAP
jgi:hypothetical protein